VPKAHLFGLALAADKVVIGGTGLLLVGSSNGDVFKMAEVTPKVTYGYIYSIAPRCKEGFVAVGKGGWIYLTDEKASQWRLADKR
jgi:phage pi2 protein 07